jgi:predicted phosphodiesterase
MTDTRRAVTEGVEHRRFFRCRYVYGMNMGSKATQDLQHTTESFSYAFPIRTKNSVNSGGAGFSVIKGAVSNARPGYNIHVIGGKVVLELIASDSTTSTATSTVYIADGEWHDVACVVDRSDGVHKAIVEVDGVETIAAGALGADSSLGGNATDEIRLSHSYVGPTQFDIGPLMHFGDKALSSAERVILRAHGDVSGLTNCWTFEERANINSVYSSSGDGEVLQKIVDRIYDTVGDINITRTAQGWWGEDRFARRPNPDTVLAKLEIVTDMGEKAAVSQVAWLNRAIYDAQRHDVDAIVGMGDMVDAPDATSYTAINDALAAQSLPVYFVAGNHEAGDLASCETHAAAMTGFEPSEGDPESGIYWHQEIGESVVLIGLCNFDAGAGVGYGDIMSEAQFEWLEGILAAYSDRKAIVLSHMRLDQDAVGGDGRLIAAGLSVYHSQSAQLRAIFEAAGNVSLVLAGHEHAQHYGAVNGIEYLTFNALEGGEGYGVLTLYANDEYEFEAHGSVIRSIPRRPVGVY